MEQRDTVFLTPYDLEVFDPTGRCGKKVRSYRDTPPTPAARECKTHPKEWLARLQELRAKILKNRPTVLEWDAEWDEKYGPQGGYFSLESLKEQYDNSYLLAARTIQLGNLWIGRDYLCRIVRQIRDRVGGPHLGLDELWRGTDGTFAGSPTAGLKGTYVAETHVPGLGWRHVFPNVPGERFQRSKKRSINMDATSNVRYIEKILGGVRNWLRQHIPDLFSGWINPTLGTSPRLTQHVQRGRWFDETDFDGCDQHFGFDLIAAAVLPIYEILLPPMEFMRFASFIEECYEQPVLFDTYARVGKHNSLSGQAHVSDFETLYGVELGISAALDSGLHYGQYDIFAIGDDLTVSLEGNEKHARKVFERLEATASANGMPLKIPKCFVGRGRTHFAKRYYEPGLPGAFNSYGQYYIRGAYPSSLTLNTICNPEHRESDLVQALIADIQRFDNLEGNPVYKPLAVQFFADVHKDLRAQVAGQPLTLSISDWWTKLYGETWTLGDSHTFKLIRSNGLL